MAASFSSEYERPLHYDIGYKLLHKYGSHHRQTSRAISFSSSSSALDELEKSGSFNRPRKDAKSSEIRSEFPDKVSSRHEFKPRRSRPSPSPAPTVSRLLETSYMHRNNCNGCQANHLDRLHVNVPLSDRSPRLASVAGSDISIIGNDVQQKGLDIYSQQAVKNNSMHEVAMHARDRLQEKFRSASLLSNRMQTALIAPRVVYYGPSEAYVDCIDQETNINNRLIDQETNTSNRLSTRSGEAEKTLRSALSPKSNSRPLELTKIALPREVFAPTVRNRESEDGKSVLEQEECPICLEPFLSGEQIKLSCFHRFHIVCLSPWLLIHKECPYCRSNVLLNQ